MDSTNSDQLSSEKYKKCEYWDERYRTEESFDWFHDLSAFEHLLTQHVKRTDRILVLGCGNSTLSERLYQRGYPHIDNVDFSEVVIKKMRERTRRMTQMKWYVMDMLELGFEACSFDVVVDKGSMDSLMVDQGDVWNPRAEVICRVQRALDEASRVLKTSGHFISITFSQPHFRGRLLCQERFNWSVRHWTFGDYFHYFYYLTTKGKEQDSAFDYSYRELYEHKSVCFESLDYFCCDDENFLFSIEEDLF